jgi:hypothetical protein
MAAEMELLEKYKYKRIAQGNKEKLLLFLNFNRYLIFT